MARNTPRCGWLPVIENVARLERRWALVERLAVVTKPTVRARLETIRPRGITFAGYRKKHRSQGMIRKPEPLRITPKQTKVTEAILHVSETWADNRQLITRTLAPPWPAKPERRWSGWYRSLQRDQKRSENMLAWAKKARMTQVSALTHQQVPQALAQPQAGQAFWHGFLFENCLPGDSEKTTNRQDVRRHRHPPCGVLFAHSPLTTGDRGACRHRRSPPRQLIACRSSLGREADPVPRRSAEHCFIQPTPGSRPNLRGRPAGWGSQTSRGCLPAGPGRAAPGPTK